MHIQDQTASTFNLEGFNEIVKDVRNTHKAVIALDDVTASQEKFAEARKNLDAALKKGGIEGLADVTKYALEMKRAQQKIDENPELKQGAFAKALAAFVDFTATNGEDSELELAA